MVLGFMCLVVFYFAFLRGMFSGGGTTTVTVKASPTPKPAAGQNIKPGDFELPSANDQRFEYETRPIVYRPGAFGGPDPGRNIFAFYEPGILCKVDCPSPTPKPTVVKTPEPPPPPDIQIAFLNPQSVYAGSKGFRMEIAGDRFTPDTRIYFSQQEIPSTFVNAQRMTADIPGVLITGDGQRQILAQTADGKLHSNPVMLDVQPAPKPQVQYIGMIARTRSNNDTAYFKETGKEMPIGARLNDVVEGRFRLLSISAQETILEDVNLGFRHKLPLFTPPPGTVTSPTGPGRPGFPSRESYVPFNPPAPSTGTNTRIPGIPDNIPRYVPPTSNANRPVNPKKDADDDEDTDN